MDEDSWEYYIPRPLEAFHRPKQLSEKKTQSDTLFLFLPSDDDDDDS